MSYKVIQDEQSKLYGSMVPDGLEIIKLDDRIYQEIKIREVS